MPIQQGQSISSMLGERKRASDTITKILNKETRPSVSDAASALTQNMMAVNDRELYKPTTTQGVFEGRRASEIAPQATIMALVDGNIKAGGEETKAIMESFGKFADNPDDLAKLFAAAEADPEEITSANASTFAARKAQELGLQSVKKMHAQAQLNYSLSKGKEKASKLPSWLDADQQVSGEPDFTIVSDSPGMQMAQDGILPPPEISEGSGEDIQVSVPRGRVVSINGRQVDVNRFPAGVAAAKDYGDRKEIRKSGNAIINGKDGQTALQTGKEADATLASMRQAENALNNIEKQGKTTGELQGLIGGLLDNPDFEILNKVEAGTAMAQRVPGTGAVSNFDAAQLLKQAPGARQNPETIRAIIADIDAKFTNAKQYSDFFRWYVSAFGTTDGLDSSWEDFRQANPMIRIDGRAVTKLPGYNAKWEDYFSGRQPKVAPKSQPTARKAVSEMTDEELDAYEAELRGQ